MRSPFQLSRRRVVSLPVCAAVVPWLLTTLAAAPLAQGTALAYPVVSPGLEYTLHRSGDAPLATYVVSIDRSRADLRFVATLGAGMVYGLQTVRDQVAALPPAMGAPAVAVNGDFFIIRLGPYMGDPTGLQIMEGELISTPDGSPAFWVDTEGRPRIGTPQVRLTVTWPHGARTPTGLNQQRPDDGAVLYTPRLGPSTHTTGGRELVLERHGDGPWLPLRVGQALTARIARVCDGGDAAIPGDAMVLSLGPELLAKLPACEPGAVLELSVETSPDLTGVRTAIGGGPILLKEGAQPAWNGNQPRHPRTAVGWNERRLYLIVVDGRQADLSRGMTLPELADFAQSLGCTDAINLDGGGSSTLWLGGEVVNSPSDGRERPVANALVVVREE